MLVTALLSIKFSAAPGALGPLLILAENEKSDLSQVATSHLIRLIIIINILIILIISLRIFPKIAERFITFATFARRWLVSMTKLSIFFPILVLWMLGRIATVLVVGMLGSSIDITAEQDLIVGLMGGATVPQNSFLDLMTALSVLPLAAFTTLTVLGGANKGLPQWLKVDDDWIRPDKPEPIPEVRDLLDQW